MKDFETHPRGTGAELVACRELARTIEQLTKQYGAGILPIDIMQAYNKLKEVYTKQFEMENMEGSIHRLYVMHDQM